MSFLACADHGNRWTSFLARVKDRPPAFYAKCVERLQAQDLYDPTDLCKLDREHFSRQLQQSGATAGEVTFLLEAVEFASASPMPSAATSSMPPPSSAASVHAGPVPAMAQEAVGKPPVISVLLPGTEDPAELMRRGGLQVNWVCHQTGVSKRVNTFVEETPVRVMEQGLALPTLYLHFLDQCFLSRQGEFNDLLRGGNDNSEIMLVLPEAYSCCGVGFGANVEVSQNLQKALGFLRTQCEAGVTGATHMGGTFGPKANFSVDANPQRLFFGLKTSRPKAPISLEKKLFGIPEDADIYLFAENHISVNYMSPDVKDAFLFCITELPGTGSTELQKLGTFLKIFCEGGFAYNRRDEVGRAYIPTNVGIAGLGTTPSFPDQVGMSTGYPYSLSHQFLSFPHTVPVTIDAISSMSERHGRYGLCFTRCVHVWEDEALLTDSKLKFCSILPHGGFYYVPDTLPKHLELGGLVYAFGESVEAPKSAGIAAEPLEAPARLLSQSQTPLQRPRMLSGRLRAGNDPPPSPVRPAFQQVPGIAYAQAPQAVPPQAAWSVSLPSGEQAPGIAYAQAPQAGPPQAAWGCQSAQPLGIVHAQVPQAVPLQAPWGVSAAPGSGPARLRQGF